MAKLNLTLPYGEIAVTGKQVTFVAPCDSDGLTHIILQGTEYELVDSNGNNIISGAFVAQAMVSVVLNVENQKAYIQNADINFRLKSSFAGLANSITDNIIGDSKEVPKGVSNFASLSRIAGISYRNVGNFLPYPYTETTVTKNGVTFTDNRDGTITLNGTATSTASFKLCGKEVSNILEVGNTYDVLLKGEVSGVFIQLNWYDVDGGVGNINFYGPIPWKQGNSIYDISINVRSGATFNNVVVRPILYNIENSTMDTIESTEINGIASIGRDSQDNFMTSLLQLPSNLFPLRGVKQIDSSLKVVGTYRDYIEFHNGLARKYEVCEEITLNGSETWSGGHSSGSINQYFTTRITTDTSKYVERAIVCDKYESTYIDSKTDEVGVDCYASSAFGGFVVSVRPKVVEKFKNSGEFAYYLKDNPIKVVIARKKPIETNYHCCHSIEVATKGGSVHFAGKQCEELESTIEYFLNENEKPVSGTFVGHLNGSASNAITANGDIYGNPIHSTYSLKPIISLKDIVAGETPLATGQSYHVYE